MLLLAAGRSTRFGGEVPKAYLPLCGRPLLLHSAERLARLADTARGDELIVVVANGDRDQHLRPLLPALTALGARIVDGGPSRQASMQCGLAASSPDCELVLVHDAARPLFPVAEARTCLERAAECGAALLATPVADTLKRVGDDLRVLATIDRQGVYCAMTPQVVRRDVLVSALRQAAASGFEATDDVALVEARGGPVAVVPCPATNLKVTRREDLAIAAALLAADAAAGPA